MHAHARPRSAVPILLLLACTTYGQDWQWAERAHGTGNASAGGIAADVEGNIYVVGNFHGAITVGGTTLDAGASDGLYIAKYDVHGALQWARKAASAPSITAHGITVDDEGRIGVVGLFLGTAVFGEDLSVAAAGAFDAFVAQYAATGDVLWAHANGGEGFDYGAGVAHDADGALYAHGDLHMASFNLSASVVFVTKYTVNGDVAWTRTSDAPGNFHLGNAIAVDASGDSYITGQFFDSIAWNGLTLHAGNPEATIYVAKLDADGAPVWAQEAGAGGYAGGVGIGVDAQGEAVITGFYHGTIAFGPITLPGPGSAATDPFVAKCGASDGTFLWAMAMHGPGGVDEGIGISVEPDGGSWVTGPFSQDLVAGGSTLSAVGSSDVFLVHLSAEGNVLTASACGGPSGDAVAGVVADADQAFIAGAYQDAIAFGQDHALPGVADTSDVFVTRFGPASPDGIPEVAAEAPSLFPDPVVDRLFLRGLDGTCDYAIMDEAGRCVQRGSTSGAQGVSATELMPGTYVLLLNERSGTHRERRLRFVRV